MRILVTGGSGFVGRHLLPALRAAGHEVVAPSRAQTGDLCGSTDWQPWLAGVDAVVHLAARVHVMQDTAADPLAAFRAVNVEGTRRLAQQAQAAGVTRFVFVSSIKVNGEQTAPGRPFRAEDTPVPQDPYGISKYEAEQLLLGMPALQPVIVRPALVYGAGARGNLERLVRLLRRGLPLPLAAIRNRRAMLDVADLVDFLRAVVEQPAAAGRVFLLADAQAPSTPELIRQLAVADGRRARLWPFPPALLALAAYLAGQGAAWQRLAGSLEVDSAPARALPGWSPRADHEESLRALVRSL
jgi:nucleoside-diphosphate-sugar epimerase